MFRQSLITFFTSAALLSASPVFAKSKVWCCEKGGAIQMQNKKKMCIRGKSAPSSKSKAKSTNGKLFASCKAAQGSWTEKVGKKPKKKKS